MKFIINRDLFLPPLQHIVGVIEKRQTMPILANVLLEVLDGKLAVTGTDLEIQLVATLPVQVMEVGSLTIPSRKLLDICRYLPGNTSIAFEQQQDKMKILANKSRFTLSCLPAESYPEFTENDMAKSFVIPSKTLQNALEKTLFCMANQDVRYYLNGLLLNVSKSKIKLVASDGHRLAIFETALPHPSDSEERLILPRKGALELYRLLGNVDSEIKVNFSNSNIKVQLDNLTFSAKLVDAKYPDFSKVFQQAFFSPLHIPKLAFKEALTRVAVLANEKFKAVTLDFADNLLKISAQNPEHDEAEEEITIDFSGEPLSISFNAQYLSDAVSYIESEDTVLTISSNSSCCFIDEPSQSDYKFIVMPMRL